MDLSENLVDINKVAEFFNVPLSEIEEWIEKDIIEINSYIKIENTYRFQLSKIVENLQKHSNSIKKSNKSKDIEKTKSIKLENLSEKEAFKKGNDFYFETEDEEEGLKYFKIAAEKGHIVSQYYLGFINYQYLNNEEEAKKWFYEAAKQNDLESIFMFGYLSQSMKWLTIAADRGHVEAQYELGLISYEGNAIAFEDSWDNNYGFCYHDLRPINKPYGDLYFKKSKNIDYKQALKRFHQAAQKNYIPAIFMIGLCYYFGFRVTKNLDKAIEFFKKDKKLFFDLFYTLSEHSSADAKYIVGICYLNGFGTPKDEGEGISWLEIAKNLGSSEAKKYLNFYK